MGVEERESAIRFQYFLAVFSQADVPVIQFKTDFRFAIQSTRKTSSNKCDHTSK